MGRGRLLGIALMVFGLMILTIGESSAAEKKFPTRPINVIIPFQPGDTDNNLRPFTDKMAQYLGQPLNFVYKSGASGAVGAGFVATADPDGYTLVLGNSSIMVLNPMTMSKLRYDPVKDFVPIAILCNIVRVTATGFLHVLVDPKYTQGIYHDMLGLAMLPLAFGLYGLLAWFMASLFVEEDEEAGNDVIVRRRPSNG